MRKLTLLLALSLIATFGLKAQNQASKLPSDTWMVFSFNTGNLNKKIDLDRIKRLEMMEYGFNMVKRQFGEDSTAIKKIYDDPKNYGVDLTSSAKFFMRMSKNDEDEYKLSPVFMMNLSKSKKFEKLLKLLFENEDEYKDFLEIKKGYKVYKTRSLAIAWTKKTVYFTNIDYSNRDTIDEDIASLMNPLNSLIANKSYQTSAITKNDLSYWLDYDKYLAYTKEQIGKWNDDPLDFDLDKLKGIESSFSFNFAKGALILDGLSKMNNELTNENKKIYSKRINPEFFNLINGDSLVAMGSGAVDILELKSYVEKNYEEVLDSLEHSIERSIIEEMSDSNATLVSLREQLDTTDSYSDRRELRDSIRFVKDSLVNLQMESVESSIDSTLNEFGLSREEAWDFFKGDFMIASTGMYLVIDTVETYEYIENEDGEYVYAPVESTEEVPVPLFTAMATVNLKDKCATALKKLDEEGLIEKEEGKDYYNLTVSKYDYYIILKDDILLYTNDKSLIDVDYKKGSNVFNATTDTRVLKNALTSSTYGFVDINRVMDLIPEDEGAKQYLEKVENRFDYFEFVSKLTPTNDIMSKVSWTFNNKEDNSLHNLFDLANDYFKMFQGL